MNVSEIFAKYGKMAMDLPYSVGEHPMFLMRYDKYIAKTADTCDFANITEEDIVNATHFSLPERRVLSHRKDRNAMFLARPPYIGKCLDEGTSIFAAIDDMAQIIGMQAEIVPRDVDAIAAALRRAEACLVEDENGGYAVTCGRTLYEAFTAMTVLEKGALVMLKARVLGGAKPVDSRAAKIEHLVYMFKYSKAEKEIKSDVEL